MIEIKTPEQIDKMRRANLIVAEVLEELARRRASGRQHRRARP